MHTLFWKTRNCINGSQLTAALRRCKGPHSNLPRSCRTFRSNAGNYSKDPANSRLSSLSAVSDWIKKCWDHDKNLPAFAVNGDKITILTKPQDFYQTLKSKASKAQHRIVLASLYLGNGKLEGELVDTMYQRTKEMVELNKSFQIHVLLDHPRASRGKKNSKTMLLPLVKDFGDNVKVCMYHAPKLRGLLYRLIPERFNETISAMHIKAYIFDDTIVMSGANLSNDYFTNRQDRCIVFEDNKELCDYFHDLIKTVSSFSLELQPDCTTAVAFDCSEHPYQGNKQKYIEIVKEKLNDFIQRYRKFRNVEFNSLEQKKRAFIKENKDQPKCEPVSEEKDDDSKQMLSEQGNKLEMSNDKQAKNDTFVIPTLQLFYYGIRQDELFTSQFLESSPPESKIFLATAYFNITNQHWNEVITTKSKHFDIVMAHPLANGFYKAPGPAGGIPHAYTLIARQCFKDIMRFKQQDRIRFWEYQRQGWTFHGKGLWAKFEGESVPYITMAGSSNFGNRSVYRDMEAQLTILTTNERLAKQLDAEERNFLEYSEKVVSSTYKDPSRKVPLWVFLIRSLMRTFF